MRQSRFTEEQTIGVLKQPACRSLPAAGRAAATAIASLKSQIPNGQAAVAAIANSKSKIARGQV